jgi:hypothetical protein
MLRLARRDRTSTRRWEDDALACQPPSPASRHNTEIAMNLSASSANVDSLGRGRDSAGRPSISPPVPQRYTEAVVHMLRRPAGWLRGLMVLGNFL